MYGRQQKKDRGISAASEVERSVKEGYFSLFCANRAWKDRRWWLHRGREDCDDNLE